jgi:hypothetical protein
MHKFILEGVVNQAVAHESVVNWIYFLTEIVNHEELQITSCVKGNAYLLLAYFLSPLLNLLNPEFTINDDNFMQAIQTSIAKILNEISDAFQYEELGILCATEFTQAVEHRPDVCFQIMNNFQAFYTMLSIDVSLYS